MPSILVVTGSVRPNSVNEKVVPLVVAEVEAQGATAVIADLKALDLPFFDDASSPLAPGFSSSRDNVNDWTQMVADADGVILVTPEYNHTLTPVQINAIDWIGKEWANKPIALVGYGWGGATLAHATVRQAMSAELQATILETTTNLFFTKDLAVDGEVLDANGVASKLKATVAELVETN